MLDQGDLPPILAGAPDTTEFRKLRKRIVRLTREALETYGMVRAGDRWLVCLSGGKDSYTLLAALIELQWRGLLPVDLLACNLDQGQPGFPATVLPDFLARMGVPHRIEYRDTYSVVTARCRRAGPSARSARACAAATSTAIAREEGCAAVVLGHHRDDIIETFLLNLFHGGTLDGDAAEAPQRRGRPVTSSARSPTSPRPIARASPGRWAIRSSRATSAAARTACSARQVKRMVDEWEARSPGPPADPVPCADPGEAEPPARHSPLRLQGAVKGHRTAGPTRAPRLICMKIWLALPDCGSLSVACFPSRARDAVSEGVPRADPRSSRSPFLAGVDPPLTFRARGC